MVEAYVGIRCVVRPQSQPMAKSLDVVLMKFQTRIESDVDRKHVKGRKTIVAQLKFDHAVELCNEKF